MPYQYNNVWKQITPELSTELAAFWKSENALPANENAEIRAQQAVVVMRDEQGTIAAVSTAILKVVPRLRQKLYYYRTFCAVPHRGNHTVQAMAQEAKKALHEYNQKQSPAEAIGILVELESNQLSSQYNYAYHAATDFGFIGYSQRDLPLFAHYFPGAILQPPIVLKR